MYGITATLFTLETGSLVTGLTMGVVGSSLKTLYAAVYHRVTARKASTVHTYEPLCLSPEGAD
jgi:hypothetical protein